MMKNHNQSEHFMQNGGRFWTNEILVGMGLYRIKMQKWKLSSLVTAVEASLDKNLHGKDFNAG